MDVFGCAGPPSRFEIFLVCLAHVLIVLCFAALPILAYLVISGALPYRVAQ